MKTLKNIIIISIIFVISCITFIGCGKKEINLNDYVEMKVTGYDGHGKMSIRFQWDELRKDLKISEKEIDTYGNVADFFEKNGILYTLNKRKGFSNGENAILEWNIDETLISQKSDAIVVYNDIDLTVEGLEVLPTFDAFEDLAVTFSGKPGVASIVISGGHEDFEYETTKQKTIASSDGNMYYEINNGDVITVEIVTDVDIEEIAKKYGSIPKTMTKEYLVAGLDEPVTKMSDIPEADWAVLDEGAQFFVKNYSYITIIGFIEPKLIEKGIKDGSVCYIYEFAHTEQNFSYYWYVKFGSIIKNGDGTISYDVSKGSFPSEKISFRRNRVNYYGYETLEELKEDNRLTDYTWDVVTE